MESSVALSLQEITLSLRTFFPELILAFGMMLLLVAGLFTRNAHRTSGVALVIITTAASFQLARSLHAETSISIFHGFLSVTSFTSYLGFLVDVGGILTILMSWPYLLHTTPVTDAMVSRKRFISEYYILIIAIVLGAHLLISSTNLLMVFMSLELVSIPSYVLAGFLFDKRSSEGSLKYFIFGSVASAVMLYGFSIYYGVFGTLDFTSIAGKLASNTAPVSFSPLLLLAGVFSLGGFLYKVAAAPMHPWAPDVYEAAPMPVVAFFSVVPKIAGLAILFKFIHVFPQPYSDGSGWSVIIGAISILTITVGNFSALAQKSPKRMMAYSSIAQSGFLMIGMVANSTSGLQFMVFYSTVYLIMNFLVFFYLQYFEHRGFTSIASYENAGFKYLWPSIFLLVGMISLTGLPPTGGFTAKLFIFTALWEAYSFTGKQILLWLLVFGLLNTVVSLFYYLRIPYYAFIKTWESTVKTNILTQARTPDAYSSGRLWMGNLFGLILVIVLLLIFFAPGFLMGWINKINFVL
jgi:NADH-quinone oxidoreductase subunit N